MGGFSTQKEKKNRWNILRIHMCFYNELQKKSSAFFQMFLLAKLLNWWLKNPFDFPYLLKQFQYDDLFWHVFPGDY